MNLLYTSTRFIPDILLTSRCSEQCDYCDFPLLENPSDATKENIDYFFKNIVPRDRLFRYTRLGLVGGEIGLLDMDTLDYFFTPFVGKGITFNIMTNGLFLKKDYHKRYKNMIHSITYHMIHAGKYNETTKYVFNSDVPTEIAFVAHHFNLEEVQGLVRKGINIQPYTNRPLRNQFCLTGEDKKFIESVTNIRFRSVPAMAKSCIERHSRSMAVYDLTTNVKRLCCRTYIHSPYITFGDLMRIKEDTHMSNCFGYAHNMENIQKVCLSCNKYND